MAAKATSEEKRIGDERMRSRRTREDITVAHHMKNGELLDPKQRAPDMASRVDSQPPPRFVHSRADDPRRSPCCGTTASIEVEEA